MVKFNGPEDVVRWLRGRPEATQWRDAVMLAARAAARVLPLAATSSGFEFTTATFRATALARVAAMYPTRANELGAAAAAATTHAHYVAGYAATAAAARATDAASYATEAVAATTTIATDTATIATAATTAAATTAAANAATTADATLIEVGLSPFSRALWLQRDPETEYGIGWAPTPKWALDAWQGLRKSLLADGDHWQVWIDWYEAISRGKSPFPKLKGKARESLEMQIALIPDEDWEKGAKHVNDLIKKMIDDAHAHLKNEKLPLNREKSGVAANPPEVPPQHPAAVEPVDLPDGRIGLPTEPIPADLDRESIEAALKANKEGFNELADDAEDAGNVDKRAIRFLRRIADRIPETVPTQHELFRIAHVEDALNGYSRTVNQEWPSPLAATYHALKLQFENTMRQFPRWRQFKRNAELDRLDAEQVSTAGAMTLEFSMKLEGEEAKRYVEPKLAEALKRLAGSPAVEATDMPAQQPPETLSPVKEHWALDAIESVNNTLKKIAGKAFAFLKAAGSPVVEVGKGIGEYVTGIGTGARKKLKELGPEDGEKLVAWFRGLLIKGKWVAGGTAVFSAATMWANKLIEKFPKMFGWLEAAIEFLKTLSPL